MTEAFICDAIRTPFGRYGGALAHVRTDDLAAIPLRALIERNAGRRLGSRRRRRLRLRQPGGRGQPQRRAHGAAARRACRQEVPGTTVNRLCGSSLDAVAIAARAIKSGETSLMLAGGVESMSRAPFVMGKADERVFARREDRGHDDRLALRQSADEGEVRHRLDARDRGERRRANSASPAPTRTRSRCAASSAPPRRSPPGASPRRSCRSPIPQKKGDPVVVERDEHPRATTLEALAKLKGVVRPDGTVTAGNASGVNDGACALLIASEDAATTPRAHAARAHRRGRGRRRRAAHHGLRSRAGDAQGARARRSSRSPDMDVIELNEAFAAQALAVTRDLGFADDAAHVNPERRRHRARPSARRERRAARDDGAVPAARARGGRYALCTMCIGVGQGIAIIIERV